jgi:flagellar biosynthesis protein FlhB
MAEEEQTTDETQKTEDPTPRRLEEARKRGQVIHSREINNWVMIFTATVLVVAAGPGVMSDLRDTLKIFLEQAGSLPADPGGLGDLLKNLLFRIGGILALPLLILAFAGAFAGLVQTGPLLSFDPVTPDLSKISLIKGFQRLFSGRSIVEFLKGIAKLVIVSIAGILVLTPYFDGVEHFTGIDFNLALSDLQSLFLQMMVAVLAVLFVLAVLDYLYQRHDYLKKMRMSKQELKDEFKQTEGDPHVKARLRELREAKARQRMMQAVPTADVVITNPTHYAVALKYDSKAMNAPVLVAKGMDAIAEKIREVAKENKVPVVENPPLARGLYAAMEIDQMIPQEYYKAVAEVISYVFRMKGKRV